MKFIHCIIYGKRHGFCICYTFKNMKHLSSDVSLCKIQGKSELLKKEEKKFCFLYCTKWYFFKVYAKIYFYPIYGQGNIKVSIMHKKLKATSSYQKQMLQYTKITLIHYYN